MAETNAQRKKRRVVPNTIQDVTDAPALPPSVIPLVRPSTAPPPPTPQRAPNLRQEGILPSLGRGVESGVETLSGLREGAIGAAAGAAGFEEEAQRRLVSQQERETAASLNAPRIERVQDVTNIQDAAEFVAGIAGKQGVIFAPIVAGAVAGAAVSPLLPISAAAGAATGAIGTGIGLETGDAFSNIVGDPESVENLGVQGASLTALGTGAVSGALEAVPALAGLGRLGLLKPFQRAVRGKLAERVAKGTLSQAGIEGLTEGAQTIVQRTGAKFANENRDIFGDDFFDEFLNSVVSGAIFGGGIGAVTGAVGGRGPEPGSIDDSVDLEETLDELDQVGGRSTDIEDEIDRLGEPGQDIRDARLRPSLNVIRTNPTDVIEDLFAVSREAGGELDRVSQSRLLAAVRELDNPFDTLTDMLIVNGTPDAPGTAQALMDRAGVEEEEFLAGLADAPSQGEIVDADETIEDDAGDKEFTLDQGFQDINVTETHILRNANGALGFAPPDVRFGTENALDRAVVNLGNDFPEADFRKVGLGDAIADELDKEVRGDPEQLNRILNDVAAEKLNEPAFNTEKFGEPDPSNPRAFLNQFFAIRKDQVAGIFTGKNILRLTDRDVFGGPGRGVVTPSKTGTSVQQPVQKPLVVKRKANREGDLPVTVPVKKIRPGPLTLVPGSSPQESQRGAPITETVQESQTLDAVKLTNLMLTKLEKLDPTSGGPRTTDVVANAFFNGLAGLASQGIVVDPANLKSDLVVSKKGGKDITYGEISTQGAGRIRARIANFKAESKRLQEALQAQMQKIQNAGDVDTQRRAKFIAKKFKRRIKKIPGDIETMALFGKSTAGSVKEFNQKLKSAKALLDAEAQDTESFAKLASEIEDLVFNLRKEGVSTLPVEEMSDIAREMQVLVDAGQAERTRIRKERAPEGSQDFEESTKSEELSSLEKEEFDQKRLILHRLRLREQSKGPVGTDHARGFSDKGDGINTRGQAQDDTLQAEFETFKAAVKIESTMLLEAEAIAEHLLETVNTDQSRQLWQQMKDGETSGLYDPAADLILINPFWTNQELLIESISHEVGHAVFIKHLNVEGIDGTLTLVDSVEADTIHKEFLAWRKEFNKDGESVALAMASKKMFFTAVDYIMFGDNATFADLSKEQRSYVLDFEEWFADQVGRFLTTQGQAADQKTAADGIFKGLAKDIIALFKSVIDLTRGFKPAESVQEFMDNLVHKEAEVEILSSEFSSILKTADLPSDTPAVAGVMQALDPFGKSTPWMLRKAFTQVLTEEERRTLLKFFSRASTKRRLKELTGTQAQKDVIEQSPLHAAVFGYQMWMAGKFGISSQGAKILEEEAGISQADVAGPVSQFVLDMFTNIFDRLASVFGLIHQDQQAEQILVAIREGYIDQRKAGQRRWSVQTQLKDTLLQRIGGTFNAAFEHLKPFYDRALVVADQRMLDTGIPGLMKIARGYHAAVGQENQGETFFEARTSKIGLFMTSYTRLTAELRADPDLKTDVLAALRNPAKANKDPDVQRVTQAIFKFNRRFRNYLVAAGLEVGDRGPRYFPWVYDPRKVQENSDFINDLLMDTRFDKEVNEWLKRRNDEIIAFNVSKPQGVAERPLISRQQLVDEVVLSLEQNEGYADTELNPRQTGTTPWFANMHQRALGFLTDGKLSAAERERFDGLFSDQLDLVMMTYVRQGVKRAEYARRFGARSEKLQQFVDEATAEGASADQLRTAYQYIDAMNGVIGEGTNQRLSNMLKLGKREGEIINPTYRTFTSLMMVIQNMAVLPLATLTSLVDPVGIMVRSQDMKATMAALRAGATEIAAEIKNITGNDPTANRSELRKLAEGMGTIEDHMTNEALEWEYGSTYLTPKLKAVNEFFFKAIGLTQWTRVTRIMALAGGKEFIKRHVQRPNQNSDRFLRQLNLAVEDVRFDEGGNVMILSRMQREGASGLTEAELARDDRVRNALNRFVNESILRPNASQRPLWASDPNYALIFHLKSFMFSFHDRIIRRVAQEAALGNTAPLMLLAAFIPAMLFADILRDMIQFGFDGNPNKAHWELEDHIWNAAQRSGVTGISQLVIDGKQDIQFGGFGYESFAGPTVDGISDLDGLFSDDDEQQWRAFSRNLPGNSAWKHWIENGTDE